MSTQTWDKETILALIAKSDKAVVNALLTIYRNQTSSEQAEKTTKVRNNVGFNSRDAHILTDIAQKLPRYNNHMTPRQIALVRSRIGKYWRQLLDAIPEEKRQVPDRALAALTGMPESSPVQSAPAGGESWGRF